MANGATLPHCLMLIDKWAALLCVTFEARFVSAQECKAASFEFLLNICWRPFDRDPFVHLVTIAAAHFAFEHWMVMRQRECRADFQVTLEAGFRRLARIDDRASPTASFDMQTPRAVARFAAPVYGLLWSFGAFCAGLTHDHLFCLQPRVGGCSEIAHDLFVAGRTFLRTHELRARDAGWSKNRSVRRATRQQNYRERYRSSGAPEQRFAPAVNPSS